MKEAIQKKLDLILNPVTSVTLTSENRWKNIEIKNDILEITYQRDGISPQDKKIIEKMLIEHLKDVVSEDKLIIKTISTNSQDVVKSADSASSNMAPAQIKTGHAAPMAKKNVPGVGKVIAIGSGKGGVGKSTFTSNLAASLIQMGFKVGIIDADIYGPSIPMLLGKRNEKPMANSERKIIPLESYGIKFLSFGLFIEEKDPVIWRGPMLGGVLNQFLFDADWSGVDYLLIDLPPGTGDIQLSMVQNCHVDGAIIISTPQDVALLDATKGLEMFRKLNLPIIGMVENMSSFICSNCQHEHHLFGANGVEESSKKLEVNFLGKIPLEIELRLSADGGHPYMANPTYKGRPSWRGFENVSKNLVDYFSPTVKSDSKSGLFSRFFKS